MGERELWINVYECADGHQMIGGGYDRAQVEAWAKPDGVFRHGLRSVYRYHVRLKPEGAPRRYRDWLERHDWEKGILPDRRLPLAGIAYAEPAPSTPKIEESAT